MGAEARLVTIPSSRAWLSENMSSRLHLYNIVSNTSTELPVDGPLKKVAAMIDGSAAPRSGFLYAAVSSTERNGDDVVRIPLDSLLVEPVYEVADHRARDLIVLDRAVYFVDETRATLWLARR